MFQTHLLESITTTVASWSIHLCSNQHHLDRLICLLSALKNCFSMEIMRMIVININAWGLFWTGFPQCSLVLSCPQLSQSFLPCILIPKWLTRVPKLRVVQTWVFECIILSSTAAFCVCNTLDSMSSPGSLQYMASCAARCDSPLYTFVSWLLLFICN